MLETTASSQKIYWVCLLTNISYTEFYTARDPQPLTEVLQYHTLNTVMQSKLERQSNVWFIPRTAMIVDCVLP